MGDFNSVVQNTIAKGQLIINAAYALIFIAACVITRMVVEERDTRAAQENLADSGDRATANRYLKLLRPILSQYLVPIIRGKPFWENSRKKFRRLLIAGGLKDELTPDEFISLKIALIVIFPLIGGVLNALDFVDIDWYWVLLSGALGWFYPNQVWAKGRMQARQKKILAAMPFIVDLLALSTEAGLDFIGAIGKVTQKAKPSPLVEEFTQLLKELKLGSSRQEGLREMAARINLTEINSFVSILISADQMGASIGKILRQQSDQIRVDRLLRAEKAGARAATLVLLPTVIFVFPAVGLMIFGPILISYFYPNGGP